MKEELESKDSNIQDLTTNQNNLRMALDHTVNISVVQHDEINNLLRDNMSLYDETVQLTQSKDQLINDKGQLTNDKGRLEDDNRQLRSDNSSQSKALEQQVRVNSYLRRDVVSRDETIEQRTVQCVELKTKNKQLCKDVRQLKTDNTQKDGTISQLQTDNTQLQTDNTQKDGTISQLQTDNTQLQTENTQLQTDNTQKDGTISQLQTDNTQLQTDNTQLQTDNTQKDGTISQLQTENTEVQVQNKKLNSETRNLKKDNMLLYQRLKETTEISEQKDRQLRIQKMKVDDLSYQMSETGDRIARLEKVSEEKCVEINRLIGSNNEQAEHIQEQNDTIGDLRVRLQEQERINRDLYSQIAELRQL
jgi:chromosome segregation ATPase